MKTLSVLHALDTRLLLWVLLYRDRLFINNSARYISRSGDGYLQILTPAVAAWHGSEDSHTIAMRVFWALIFERCAYFILKNGLRRQRPPECLPDFRSLLEPSDRFSFPSGHTSAAFLLAGIAYSVFPVVGFILFIWAVCVGISRVVLGVHFPTDIIAGAVLGLSIAFIDPWLLLTT